MDCFVELCEIASPTGQERLVADHLTARIKRLGYPVLEDDCAAPARAGAGNLLTVIEGRDHDPERAVAFCAHLDTVPHNEPIRVVREGGVLRSAGETILGADNKAAVAVLIALAERWALEPPPVDVEFLFTVAEEHGLRGAHAFDISALRSKRGYVLDHASPIGEIITAAPTYKLIEAEFRGRSAHAGIRPEDGHSAIAAAATAIAEMKLGRLDESTTANVGLIAGGSAANVVAQTCHLTAEARSLDGARVAEVVAAINQACAWGASAHGCDLDVAVSELFRGYRLGGREPSLSLAERAMASRAITPVRRQSGGGSDANALRLAGYDALLLANGTSANHTPDEAVTESALVEMVGLCAAIVACAADPAESAGSSADPSGASTTR